MTIRADGRDGYCHVFNILQMWFIPCSLTVEQDPGYTRDARYTYYKRAMRLPTKVGGPPGMLSYLERLLSLSSTTYMVRDAARTHTKPTARCAASLFEQVMGIADLSIDHSCGCIWQSDKGTVLKCCLTCMIPLPMVSQAQHTNITTVRAYGHNNN